MRAKLINDAHERTYALIFDKGDEVVSILESFAAGHELTASRMTAIGAFSHVTLGYFNWEKKEYDRIEINEQVEVLSLIGDIATKGDGVKLHAHVVLGRHDAWGTATFRPETRSSSSARVPPDANQAWCAARRSARRTRSRLRIRCRAARTADRSDR